MIAEFVSDDDVPTIIEMVSKWYASNGKGYGRTRLGVILQIPDKWNSFISALRNVFTDKMLKDPKPPSKNEIHFE